MIPSETLKQWRERITGRYPPDVPPNAYDNDERTIIALIDALEAERCGLRQMLGRMKRLADKEEQYDLYAAIQEAINDLPGHDRACNSITAFGADCDCGLTELLEQKP